MKTMPYLPRFSSPGSFGRLLACLVLPFLAALRLPAAELLRNGSFAGGMDGWKVNTALSGWNPWQATGVSLSPPGYGFTGILFYQDLNVAGASGATLTVSISLQEAYSSSGNTVAVYVDYATATGQIKRLKVLNPDDSSFTTDYSTVSTNFTLPGEASKLVRLSLADGGYGNFTTTNVSLSAGGLTAGTVPGITSTSTAAGYYYSATNTGLLTLRGHDFGTVTGQVFIGTPPVAMVGQAATTPSATVVSWSDTQVVIRVAEPMGGGGIYLMAGGVESDGDFSFTVLSPTFTVEAVTPTITVVPGQTATLLLRAVFLNGFQTAGGVSFSVTNPVCPSRSSQPLFHSGGYSIDLDTTGLTNGVYGGMVRSQSEAGARFTPFTLNVTGITNIVFNTNSDLGGTNVSTTSLTVTNQGEFTYNFSYQLVDYTGQPFATSSGVGSSLAPVTVTSDNPSAVAVVNGNWGPRFFAVGMANDTANLVFTTPDGYTRSLHVAVNLLASPRYIVASLIPANADNSGLCTNTAYWQATAWPGWLSGNFSFDNVVTDPDNDSVTWTFDVPTGTAPGEYLLYSSFNGYSSGTASYLILNVVNTASRGQVAGNIFTVDSGSSMMDQEINGNLELYDATSGTGVATNSIANFNTTAYSVGYVQPGSYRIRFSSLGGMGGGTAPQWYPNATNFAQAATVVVSAGQTVSNINFYLAPVRVPPSSLLLPAPAVHCPGAAGSDWDFCVGTTVADVTYFLEYKNSLDDSTWTVAQTATGNGGILTLSDKAAANPFRFYRVRMVAP